MLQPHQNIVHIKQCHPFQHATGSKDRLIALYIPDHWLNWLSAARSFLNSFQRLLAACYRLGPGFKKNICFIDIKPENIMINGSEPVLIDFGDVVSLGQPVHERMRWMHPWKMLNLNSIFFVLLQHLSDVSFRALSSNSEQNLTWKPWSIQEILMICIIPLSAAFYFLLHLAKKHTKKNGKTTSTKVD